MSREQIERFERLRALDGRVARASAELQAAHDSADALPLGLREQLASLTDELQAIRLLISNEVEKAWNAAEADARRARRGELMGRVNDALTAETTVPGPLDLDLWPKLAGPAED